MVKPSDEEEKYFKQREMEAREEKAREAARAAARSEEARAVSDALRIDDDELAGHLVDLGFTAEVVPAFPLIPLVYVAWADGDVSSKERKKILALAESRGMPETGPAHDFLADLLENRPKEEFLQTCIAAIRRIYEDLSDEDAAEAKHDLVSLSVGIAKISGGFMGLFGGKVDSNERETLEAIVRDLGFADSDAANALLDG